MFLQLRVIVDIVDMWCKPTQSLLGWLLNGSSDNLPDVSLSFEQYCSVIFEGPFSAKTEKEKVTYLLLWIGRNGLDVYDSFQRDDNTDKYKLAPVWKKFKDYIQPKVNSWLARYSLLQCKQAQYESVDELISRCRTQAAKCKFSSQAETEARIVEQLIVGMKQAEVQEKLLEEGDSLPSLEMALDTARTFEATKDQLTRLQAKTDVYAIHTEESEWRCEKCGTHHAKSWAACPAKGQKCNTCGYVGHWPVMCVNKSLHAVNEDTEESALFSV